MNDNLICDKDCIKDLRPYEKCISLGEQSLTDTELIAAIIKTGVSCLLYTSPSPRDVEESRMPSSA